MDKLKQLLDRCKCGVHITINDHRGFYETAEQNLKKLHRNNSDEWSEISDDIKKKMIETNTIVEIQFYPDTPVSFYLIYHYDFEMAVDEALKCL